MPPAVRIAFSDQSSIFRYSQKQLYELVADASSYPHFLPFCTNARVLNKHPHPSDPSGRLHMDVELTVGFLSFKESYVSKVTCKPYESVEVRFETAAMTQEATPADRHVQAVAASSTPLFKTLDTVWRFQPASASSPHASHRAAPSQSLQDDALVSSDKGDTKPTLVTLDLSFAFANPVHAAVSATVFGQVSKLMVKAFEERCLEIYGQGKA